MAVILGAIAFAVVAWIGFVSPSFGEQPALNCAGTQYDMNQCAGRTLRAADAELNRRYKITMEAAHDEEAREKLRAAQRAWIPFRDASCAWEADTARGGSLAPLLEMACLEHRTGIRTLELTHDLERIDPGVWAGGALARLRENAPEEALRGVYWLPEGVVSADFDKDGRYDLAAVGLRPPDITGAGGLVHVLVLPAGAAKPLHAALPLGGSGLCAAPVEIRVEYTEGERPRLAIDDGACDAFRFSMAGSPGRLVYERN